MRHRAAGGFPINWLALILVIAWAVGFGVLAARTALERSRNPLVWLGFGAVLGPIATLILGSAPPGNCPACLEPTRGWLFLCTWCGSDTRRAAEMASGTALAVQVPHRGLPSQEARARTSDVRQTATSVAGGALTSDGTSDGVLAGSGVFVGGSAPLIPGARYSLVVRGETFDVVGPVDSAPARLALSRRLDALDATVVGGRLLVSGVGIGRGRFTVAFEHLAGVDATELERALTVISKSAGDQGKAP